jgi:flagellar hook protein FlgE
VTYNQTLVNFTQGEIRRTEGDLDLAIQGRGLLVLMDGETPVFSRTGQFGIDADGFVSERALGFKLGLLSPDGKLTPLSVNGKRSNPPKATTTVEFSDNLSATAQEHTIDGVEVIDANGGKHVWTIRFANAFATTVGKWTVTIEDEKGTKIKEGELQFDGSTLVEGKDKITVAVTADGVPSTEVVLDFSKGVSGFSSGTFSSLRAGSVDGFAMGALTRAVVGDAGEIKLEYSNGQSEVLGHIALAEVDDVQSLVQRGDGLFEQRPGATPVLRRSGEGTVGTIQSKSIEASNVDLSQEFGQLILVQRGFQASSQVVSVANELIQQLFELKGRSG